MLCCVVGGYERCNDGGLASGANGPSPAQSGAIAAIEAWPTIGGSCTCFQNLRIMAIIFSFQLMNLKTSSSCSLHGWIISYHNSVETLNTWQFPLKHAAEEVRKREKKSGAKMVGAEALHLVRESNKREHMGMAPPPHQRERERGKVET